MMVISSESIIDFLCKTIILHIKALIPEEFTQVHKILYLYRIFTPVLHRALAGNYKMASLQSTQQFKKPNLDPEEMKVFTLPDRVEVRCFYSTAIKGFVVIVR